MPDYNPSSRPLPVTTKNSQGMPWVVWDSEYDAREIAEYINAEGARACVIFDLSYHSALLKKVPEYIDKRAVRRWNRVGPIDVLATAYIEPYLALTGTFPVNLGLEVLKYTINSKNYDYEDQTLRALSSFIHNQRRAGAPVTLREALSRYNIQPNQSNESIDVKLDENVVRKKNQPDNYLQLFSTDIQINPEVLDSFAGIVVVAKDAVPYTEADWTKFKSVIPSAKLLVQTRYSLSDGKVGFNLDRGGLAYYQMPYLLQDDARKFIESGLTREGSLYSSDFIAEALEHAGNIKIVDGRHERVYVEIDLARVYALVFQSAGQVDDADLEPSIAPLDAEVVDGVLTLAGLGAPDTNTPLDYLDELRAAHAEEFERLRRQLSGSNAGAGFLSRLESVGRRLQEPLTHSGSLILATQVRALEDMLPAVRDVLSDVTTADLAASISGLGLFVRQFPSWRAFVTEAMKSTEYDAEVLENVNSAVSAILEQPDESVSPSLKRGLSDIASAVNTVDDRILDVAFVGAANNTYKAIGRYVRNSVKDIAVKYGDNLKDKVASLAAELTVAGPLMVASDALFKLSIALPDEFGWLAGLLIWLSAKTGRSS